MIYIAATDITALQTRFYLGSRKFNNFKDVDKRDIRTIKLFVDYFKEVEVPKFVNKNKLFPRLDYYCQVLNFITTFYNKNVAESFDMQVLFLIFAIDPELNMYRDFLKHMPTMDRPLNYFIKDNNGIFDARLIEYEKIFFDTFLADNKLLIDVGDAGRKHAKLFLKSVPLIESFASVTNEDFERLQRSADKWFLEVDGLRDYKTAAFNIARQAKLLDIRSTYEQLVFFILTIDPEMNMLKIFEEESKIEDIKARAIEEFGFYDDNFIKLEKLYKERFFPNKKISEWTFI